MTRSQYITIAELNTILGATYADSAETTLKINEASEMIKAYAFKWQSDTDYTTTTAPDKLKLATAYQVQYNDENPNQDYGYAGGSQSVSIGQTSESNGFGGTGSQEWQKISPKAIRYLHDTGMTDDVLFSRLL